ncbi:MAG: hypothetical protein ABEH43_03725 [Flavobacteriales bacterium]
MNHKKAMKKKKLYTILAFIMFIGFLNAQTDNKPKEWTPLKNKNGVSISYKYTDCNMKIGYDKEMVLLRFKNESNDKKVLNWHMKRWRGGKCTTCDKNGEYKFQLKLPANKTVQGNCKIGGDSRLRVFSKFIGEGADQAKELEKFKLANLNIK